MAQPQKSESLPEQNVTLSFAQLKELLEAQKETPEEKLALIKAQAEENAKANRALIRPENAPHPHKSAYSYPEGDVARPRQAFRCKTIWVAEELGMDLTTAEEIELLNQLEPGRYTCTRSDGAKMRVDVTGDRDQVTGKLQKLSVWFDTRGFLRHNLPSRVAMCEEIISQQAPALVTA
jgi:hypothetical protein